MRKKRIYIVEGETEKNLFNQIKSSDIILPGKVIKANLFNSIINNKSSIIYDKKDEIICVIDSDLMEYAQLKRFEGNIKMIKSNTKNIKIIIQNKNLEDELKIGLKVNDLKTVLGVKSNKDIKSHLSNKNLIKCFQDNGIDYSLMWQDNNQSFNSLLTNETQKLIKTCKYFLR